MKVGAQPARQRHVIVAPPAEGYYPEGSAVQPGGRARIEGMVRRSDLNGAACLALWWEDDAARWAVQLLACAPGGRYERLLVRPHNLQAGADDRPL